MKHLMAVDLSSCFLHKSKPTCAINLCNQHSLGVNAHQTTASSHERLLEMLNLLCVQYQEAANAASKKETHPAPQGTCQRGISVSSCTQPDGQVQCLYGLLHRLTLTESAFA